MNNHIQLPTDNTQVDKCIVDFYLKQRAKTLANNDYAEAYQAAYISLSDDKRRRNRAIKRRTQ